MLKTKLQTILTASGCTLVLYESDKLSNITADRAEQGKVIGLILEPNDVTLEVKANAIQKVYPPVTVEILQQAPLEASAETNEEVLTALLEVCKSILRNLIADGTFKKITSLKVTKVRETKYDANLIGWAMPLNLAQLTNTTYC